MRWMFLAALLMSCGGAASSSSNTVAPSNTVAEPAPPAASSQSEVEDIEPGEPDRGELCDRAMDNVIRILGLSDQQEIQQTHAAGVRDCLASNATRDDLACFLSASRIEHLARCHDFANE